MTFLLLIAVETKVSREKLLKEKKTQPVTLTKGLELFLSVKLWYIVSAIIMLFMCFPLEPKTKSALSKKGNAAIIHLYLAQLSWTYSNWNLVLLDVQNLKLQRRWRSPKKRKVCVGKMIHSHKIQREQMVKQFFSFSFETADNKTGEATQKENIKSIKKKKGSQTKLSASEFLWNCCDLFLLAVISFT